MKISFALEKKENNVGQEIDTLVKYTKEDGKPDVVEDWCTVIELDQLFSTCVSKWGSNWDLNKIMVAINESEIQ